MWLADVEYNTPVVVATTRVGRISVPASVSEFPSSNTRTRQDVRRLVPA